jgi:Bifunctional DNA primase/polymerase, N-terminal
METLTLAQEYIQNGLSIIPLHPQTKNPLLNWEPYKRRHASKEQTEEWFSNGHVTNNIGIVTGKISLIIAFDIDGEEASACFDRAVKSIDDEGFKTALKYTLCIKTGSGNTNVIIGFREEEFASTDDKIANSVLWTSKNGNAKHNEIRLKGEGGYIVAPPSIHPNGNRYEIINGSITTITTLSKIQINKLILAIQNQAEEHTTEHDRKTNLDEEDISNIVAILKPHYQHGNRNDFAMYLSGWMRKEGIAFESSLKVLESIAADDEEKSARIRTLEETYKKQDLDKICGYSGLLSTLINHMKNEDTAKQILAQVESVFPKKQDGMQSKGTVGEEDHKSPPPLLIELAHSNTSLFFKDQHGTAFALVAPTEGHKALIALESDKFKRYLSKLFYDHNNRWIAKTEHINNAIQIIQANVEYSGPAILLSLRVAWKGDEICYDLSDQRWRYVKITKDGWQTREDDDASILFARHNQVPQVLPDKNYEVDILDRFIGLTNVKDDRDKLLLKIYIVSLFIPDIAHAMLIVHGEKGAAKSLLQRLIKQLVDPSRPTLLTIHTNRDEFVQQLSHNYVAYYDNVKTVPKWLPDEACKAVTGIGQTKRRLYTNDEDIVYEYKRCLGFSGINICLTEPDALDRSILIELTRIPRDKVKLESQILSEFEQLKPKVLGYIFDVLVQALRIKPGLQLSDLPRMADFALWGEAISQAMEKKPLEFINAYYENIGRQNIEAIESHPLAHTIAKYFEEQEGDEGQERAVEGSPMEVLEALEIFAQSHKISTDNKQWPKSPSALSRRLNQIRSNLLEGLGIQVTISRATTTKDKGKSKVNTASIEIRKIPPMSPMPPVTQNHEENNSKTTGDISSTGDMMPPTDKIPPVENHQNHAQKSTAGDTGGIGDILHTPDLDFEQKQVDENVKNTMIQGASIYDCYYCTSFKTAIQKDYERHVVFTHPEKPCYPSKADLEKLGLKAQAKDWEI